MRERREEKKDVNLTKKTFSLIEVMTRAVTKDIEFMTYSSSGRDF